MTSPKKVAANRINSRKSRGPRTSAGKTRSSRNARRHGLFAFNTEDPALSGQIRQLVDAICDGDDDLLLREPAVAIAESQLWLSLIGQEKLAALERLRDPEEDALTGRWSRRGIAKIKAKVDLCFRAAEAADDQLIEVNALIDATKRAGRDYEREPLPAHLEAAWSPAFLKAYQNRKERDEYQVLREGTRDLERLLRYEKRACSRRKKAVRWFFHRPVNLVASVKVWSCTRSANPGAIPKSAATNTISDVLSHPLNKKVDEIFNPTYLRGVIAYAKVPVGMR